MIDKDKFYKIKNGAGAKAVAEGLLANVEMLADDINSLDNTSRILRLDGYEGTQNPRGVLIRTRDGKFVMPDDWKPFMGAESILVSDGKTMTLFDLDISEDMFSYGELKDNKDIPNLPDMEAARSDMGGKENSSFMDDTNEAAAYCKEKGRYLPSSGQLYMAMSYGIELNKALAAVGKQELDDASVFWSSSEQDDINGWAVSFKNAATVASDKSIKYKVWPARDYTPSNILSPDDSLNEALWKLSEAIGQIRAELEELKSV